MISLAKICRYRTCFSGRARQYGVAKNSCDGPKNSCERPESLPAKRRDLLGAGQRKNRKRNLNSQAGLLCAIGIGTTYWEDGSVRPIHERYMRLAGGMMPFMRR